MNKVWVLETGIPEEHGSYILGVFSSKEKTFQRLDEIINKYTEEDKLDCGDFEKTEVDLDSVFLQNKCEFFVVKSFLVDSNEHVSIDA